MNEKEMKESRKSFEMKKSTIVRWIMVKWMKRHHSVHDLIEMTQNNEIINNNRFQEKVNEFWDHSNDLSIHQFNYIFESWSHQNQLSLHFQENWTKGYQMMKKDHFQQKLKIIQLKIVVWLFYQLKQFWTEKFILAIKRMIVGVIPIFSDSFQEENDLNEHQLKDFMNWEIDRLVFIYLVMKGDNTHYFMIYKSFNWNSVK